MAQPRTTAPPPPPGFTLDAAPPPPPGFKLDASSAPPPPPGFKLDSAAPSAPATTSAAPGKPSAPSAYKPEPGGIAAMIAGSAKPKGAPKTTIAEGIAAPITDTVSRARDSYERLKGDFTRPLNPERGWMALPLRAGKTVVDAMDNAFSPMSGVLDATVGRPVEAATGGAVSKRTAGDIAGLVLPFTDAAKGFTAAGRAAQKAEAIATTARKARAAPVKEVDDALYKLGGNATADKAEAQKFLKAVPKEVADPKVQARLYDEIEQKMVNPAHQIPEDLKPAMDHIEPYYKEQTDIINRIRTRHGDAADIAPYLHDEGYVARRVEGKSPLFDAVDDGTGGTPRDPIAGRTSLAKSTTALQSRKYYVTESPTGERVWQGELRGDEKPGPIEVAPILEGDARDAAFNSMQKDRFKLIKKMQDAELAGDKAGAAAYKQALKAHEDDMLNMQKEGTTTRGNKEQPGWTRKPATSAEVEANTDVRYHKNAMLNTVDNVLRLRRVERNLDTLDDITKGMKDQGLAHRVEWTRMNDRGERVLQSGGKAPEGFVELPHIPQLKGWAFDPKIANVLRDYKPAPGEALDGVVNKVNRVLTASLFVTPIPHAANVAMHWAPARGWDWLSPGAYRDLAQTGTQAAKEVLTMGPEYQRLLREGSGLLYGDTNTKNFYKLLMDKGTQEVTGDKTAMKLLARTTGLNPVALGKAIYRQSNRALWAANDIFLVQRILELEKRGMSTAKAIEAAEKDIPNYRIPSEVMGSRAVSNFLRSPYMLFGRYKYGQLRAWGEMFKDLYGSEGKEAQVEAAGKFLSAMMISQVFYPVADAAVKKATGNEEARVKRAGPFSLTDSGYQFLVGQKNSVGALASLISPSPVAEGAENLLHNQDAFGRKFIEGEATPTGKAVQAAEAAASQFYPTQLGMEAVKPGGAASAAGKLVGLELPPADREAKKAKAKKYERTRALARERKDPIQQLITGNR